MLDALGAPAEFRKYFSFPLITTMIPNVNFGFPPGVWTDQTSMTLCLAHSLATYNSPISATQGGFYEQDQLDACVDWLENGVLSATGSCVGVGVGGTIRFIVGVYINDCHRPEKQLQETRDRMVDDVNESLMRVLPVGLAYWRDEEEAKEYGRRSSMTTHPTPMCQEACTVWTGA